MLQLWAWRDQSAPRGRDWQCRQLSPRRTLLGRKADARPQVRAVRGWPAFPLGDAFPEYRAEPVGNQNSTPMSLASDARRQTSLLSQLRP